MIQYCWNYDTLVDFARLGLPNDLGSGGGVTLDKQKIAKKFLKVDLSYLTAIGCDGDLPRDLLLSEIVDAIEARSAANSRLCSCLQKVHLLWIWSFCERLSYLQIHQMIESGKKI